MAVDVLLDILWGRPPRPADLGTLTASDWASAIDRLAPLRVLPLLHWRLQGARGADLVPPDVAVELARAHRRSSLRSLAYQAELIRVHEVLDAASIPHMALKGASLAFHAYPQAGLRPMRDLDLLVPAPRVIEAFDALRTVGYVAQTDSDPAASQAVAHHLPPLRHRTGDVLVELHHRLIAAAGHDEGHWTSTSAFWGRAEVRRYGGRDVTVPSATDLLLHVLIHAVYGHTFDNGPLALTDVSFLLRRERIDWALFWDLARAGRWTRGCTLGLRMVEAKDPAVEIEWPSTCPLVPSPVLQRSYRLTLSRPEHRGDRRVRGVLVHGSLGDRIAMLARTAFPARTTIAHSYPVSPASPKAFAYYPLHWMRLVFRRMPSLVRMLRSDVAAGEAVEANQVQAWLDTTAPGRDPVDA